MSFRLFKPTFTDRKTGQQVEVSSWYIEFRDHQNVRRRWPAYTSEKEARPSAAT